MAKIERRSWLCTGVPVFGSACKGSYCLSAFAIHFAESGCIGHSGCNREISGRLHCEQVILSDQESYHDRHPMPSCTQAVTCCLPLTEPMFCSQGQLPWSKILEASPIPWKALSSVLIQRLWMSHGIFLSSQMLWWVTGAAFRLL